MQRGLHQRAQGSGSHCSGGACTAPSCTQGYGNCDNNNWNGCETPLDTTEHCGSCTNHCVADHGGTSCTGGVCKPTCTGTWWDCNGNPADGCETDLSTVTTCGACTLDTQCPAGFFCNGTQCEKKRSPGAPYTCTGGACRTGCSDDTQCATGNYCDGSGHCTAKLSTGSPCGTSHEGGDNVYVQSSTTAWTYEGLITPVFDFTQAAQVRVSSYHDYKDKYPYAGQDTAALQYSLNGINGPWTTILTNDSNYNGVPENIDVSTYVAGHTNVACQWFYDDGGTYVCYYWRVDDIVVESLE